MPLDAQTLVCCLLHQEQVVAVQHVVRLPGVHSLVKDAGIGAGVLHGDVLVLLDGLLHALLVGALALELHSLDVVLQLLLYAAAKAVGYTALVFLKGLVQSNISRSQARIALGHDVVGTEHAAQRYRTQGDRRRIHLCQLQAGLDIGGRNIALVILLGVGLALAQLDRAILDLLLGRVDALNLSIVLGHNILRLDGRLAGQHGSSHTTNGSANDHNGGACLLQLVAALGCSTGHIFHDFGFVDLFQELHKYQSFLMVQRSGTGRGSIRRYPPGMPLMNAPSRLYQP